MTKQCPECGGELIRSEKLVTYDYRGSSIQIKQPGDWCQNCGEGVLNALDRKSSAKKLYAHHAMVNNLFKSKEVKQQRIKQKLTRKRADARVEKKTLNVNKIGHPS